MVPKTEAVLIIGDSNIRHLERDILKDKLLSQIPLRVDGVSGRRAMDLTATDVDRAANYRFVVVMLGNNDLGKFRNRSAELPINVACKLIAFCQVLSEKGTRVRVVKLLPKRTKYCSDTWDGTFSSKFACSKNNSTIKVVITQFRAEN